MVRAVRWTNEKIKSLKLPEGKTEHRTMVSPGLYLYMRTRATGETAKQWQYRVQVDGKRRWLSLGTYPEVSLAQAEGERRQHEIVREAARKGEAEHPAIAARKKRIADRANPVVKDVFEEWLRRKALGSPDKRGGKGVKQRTLDLHRESFADVLPIIGEYQVARLLRADLEKCIDRPRQRGSFGAARMVYKSLREFITYCIHQEYIPEGSPDPMRNVMNPNPYRPSRPNAANNDEIQELLAAIDSSGMDNSTKFIIEFGLLTGFRPGECRLLKWAQVHLDQGYVQLAEPDVKTNQPFQLHLSSEALQLLKSAREAAGSSPYVFPGRNPEAPLGKTSVNTALRRKFRRRGLGSSGRPVRPHDLRKTFRTMLSRLGIAPEVAGLCLNHSEKEVMRKIYDGYDYRPEMLDAWKKAGEHISFLRRSFPSRAERRG